MGKWSETVPADATNGGRKSLGFMLLITLWSDYACATTVYCALFCSEAGVALQGEFVNH